MFRNRVPRLAVVALMDEKPFKEVRIMTSHPGRMRVITSALQAAEQILTDWPIEESAISDRRETRAAILFGRQPVTRISALCFHPGSQGSWKLR